MLFMIVIVEEEFEVVYFCHCEFYIISKALALSPEFHSSLEFQVSLVLAQYFFGDF